ncbi:hypothetical protein [Nesterenkonia lutea]|uniref:Holin-X, holin superfamily III n=1 Tax=Nesterenkonia lutea TaxID=272919 RepID=A0ABR9JF97_9MICC|nr:hypothetical protein [Nesterenkonia lutea]MBE1524443.1 hypothetical protein [Nesterenkonia lutea]
MSSAQEPALPEPAAQSFPGPAAEPAAHSFPGPAAARTAVRGPHGVPTVREALLSRGQAGEHALGAEHGTLSRAESSAAVRRLIRAQLRLALVLGVGFFVLLVTVSLLLTTTGVGAILLWGVPLSWVVPGLGFFPVLLATAWLFRRRAEANERTWAELAGVDLA